MTEDLIYRVGVEGDQSLTDLEKGITKAGKATSKTTDYFIQMRKELREARGEMLKNKEGTEAYNRALNKAADIQGRMTDTNDKVKNSVRDLGQTTKNVTGTIVGMAGGFQVVQASLQLFGIENENAVKAILKLQQTMSIVQGLSAFANSIDSMQDIMAVFKADKMIDSVGELSGVSSEAADSISKLSKESAVLSSNLAGNAKLSNDLKIGLDKVGEGFKDNSAEIQKLYNMMIQYEDSMANQLEHQKNLKKGTEEYAASQRNYSKNLEKYTETELEYQAVLKANNKTVEDGTIILGEAKDKLKESSKGVGAFSKSIGTSLLTMGAFLVIIAAVTFAISWLIKKLSEVPEDVKIKLELDTESLNSLVSNLTKARLFALEYNKAVKDGHTERIKQLKEIGSKEFGLNEERLAMIGTNVDAWREAFKEYLKMAEDTYFNEALAKKKSQAEVSLLVARERKSLAEEANKKRDSKPKLGAGYIVLYEALGGGELNAANKEIAKLIDQLSILDKIPYRNIESKLDFSGAGGTGKPSKTSPGKAPTFGTGSLSEAAGEDISTNLLRERSVLTKQLTEEELTTLEENLRKKDVLIDDSLIKYTEYLIKLGEARKKDLTNEKKALELSLGERQRFYDEQLVLGNKELERLTEQHNTEIATLEFLNRSKFKLEQESAKLLEERAELDGKKDAARIKDIDSQIADNNRLYNSNNKSIEESKTTIAAYKEEIKKVEEALKIIDQAPEEIAILKDQLAQLNLAIAENSAFLVDSLASNMQAMLEQASFYVDTIGQSFGGLNSMTADFMQAEDNKLAKEKNNLELSQKYREADAEQQRQMMYELELANYEAKKRTFEVNKAFQIGEVVASSAANQINIIAAWLDPKTGGPLNPANIAVAAAATVANLTTTIGSIARIKSTSLDKPVPPNSSSGSSGGAIGNIALSPNKTALTTREENLNSMYKSGKVDDNTPVVKVVDINNVQNKVKVRENNSSY